ncbi:hypothetical protein CAPTEDRAFT_200755 [Capitella teleta]|uniref:Endonuclease/exonuclease/phosphatase domain-containing protein n=1 Tax=Capitella teleta TaxID=283909 RepID=R7TJJ0_CAPTE|nr:hypothetical protein CAPTEDRAFT_200755 [Capitella teleta]|eukprot:ELT93849.1 hypothetical protein CAPTEDRAFT_200755 [Capitella teleta]
MQASARSPSRQAAVHNVDSSESADRNESSSSDDWFTVPPRSLSSVVLRSVQAALKDDRCRQDVVISGSTSNNDEKFIKVLLKLIHFNTMPVSHKRIGKEGNRPRLLLLTFTSAPDAKAFMSSYDCARKNKSPHCLYIYLNARSLKHVTSSVNKLVELQNLVASNRTILVAITETWLNDSVFDGEVLPPYFFIHRKDRSVTNPDKRGGGVLLAVDERLPLKRRRDLEPPCEVLVCELSPKGAPRVAVLLCYRPPNTDLNAFNNLIEQCIFNIFHEFSVLCLLGDFNITNVNWSHPVLNGIGAITNFIQLMYSNALSQMLMAM